MEKIETRYSVRDGGHYSPGMIYNGTLYVSGQLSINPETGKAPEGIRAQAAQALQNLDTVLSAAGAAREDVESFWSEGSLLIRDALVGAGERDGDRQAAARALAQGIGKKNLLELRELLEKLRGACAFHVGSGHLAGWLSAESWRLLSGGQDPAV